MLNLIMIKKTIIYTILFSLILIVPWAVKAQGPEKAPFVLKDTFNQAIGKVDLTPLWQEITLIKQAISNIQVGSAKTIKVFDANNQYLGLFTGIDSSNYLVFFVEFKQNYIN